MDEQVSAVHSYVAGDHERWKFMNTICRLCCSECKNKSKNILEKKILEMIELCTSLRPSENDRLPIRICSSCFHSLRICFVFRKKIEKSNILLKKRLKTLVNKQDILDIALSKAEIKILQNAIISEGKQNSKNISDEHLSTSYLESAKSLSIENRNCTSTIDIHDISTSTLTLKPNEEQVEAPMLKSIDIEDEREKTEEVHNVPLPPLVPIKPEKTERNILRRTSPEELPPLLPIKPISSKNLSPEKVSLDKHESTCCENSKNLLKNHKEICEPSKPLFCNICKKEYKEGRKLIGHLKGHMVPKTFACKICGKKYPNPSTFQIHMRSHTGERPFKCPVCNKGFTRWAGVVSHMQTHEENRPFKCDSCDQSFKILSNLERHKVLHAGVLPFCCNYCGKTFGQSANLQLHIRTYHTNERPYLCSQCGKGFVSSTRLNRHMWVHTGYKPFHCKICSKAYSNSGDLKNHESGAHGNGESEKPFACNLCDKRFFYSCRLNKHFKTHQRLHACSQCDKTFRSSNILDQHVESKHSIVPFTNGYVSKSDNFEETK